MDKEKKQKLDERPLEEVAGGVIIAVDDLADTGERKQQIRARIEGREVIRGGHIGTGNDNNNNLI